MNKNGKTPISPNDVVEPNYNDFRADMERIIARINETISWQVEWDKGTSYPLENGVHDKVRCLVIFNTDAFGKIGDLELFWRNYHTEIIELYRKAGWTVTYKPVHSSGHPWPTHAYYLSVPHESIDDVLADLQSRVAVP